MNTSSIPISSTTRTHKVSPILWLLYLLIFAFPLFSIQPKIFRPDWWIASLIILIFILNVLLRGKIRIDSIGRAAIGLNATVLVSITVNSWNWERPQWTEFFTLWLQLLLATFLYLAISNLKLSYLHLRSIFRSWIIVSLIVALYGIYQALARNLGWPLAYLPYLHGEFTEYQLQWGLGFVGYIRPSSLLREPTYLGKYLVGPVLFTGALFFSRQDQIWLFRSRYRNATALIIMLTALIASFALATYLTLVIVFLLGLSFKRRMRRSLLRVGIMLFGVFGGIILISKALNVPFVIAVQERIASMLSTVLGMESAALDPSTQVRLQEAILAILVWIHHPITGVGLNQLQFVGVKYAPWHLLPWLVERGYTHNMWLEVLVQLGILGFIFFGLMWIQALRMMKRIFQHGKKVQGPALGLFYILLATAIQGFMGGPFTFTLYWFYLGMASVIYWLDNNKRHARVE